MLIRGTSSAVLMPSISTSADIVLTHFGFTYVGIVWLFYCKIMPVACTSGTGTM